MKAILIIVFILSAVSVFCATLTVDNNVPSIGQYATLQAAHDAASNGDKIILIPSNEPYYGINVTKQLDINGVGWHPAGYDNYFVKKTNIAGNISFDLGSNGSRLIGLGGDFVIAIIRASYIRVSFCKISQLIIGVVSNGEYEPNVGIEILKCCIGLSAIPITLHQPMAMSIEFHNNIVFNTSSSIIVSNKSYDFGANHNVPLSSFHIFVNNTITSPSNGDFIEGGVSCSNATLLNNIMTHEVLDSTYATYNILGANARASLTSDYHTVSGSVAINAGNPNIAFNDLDGTRNDCGAYGGPTPFVDGGIPGLPAIYEINGPGVATPNETIQVQIKAKTNRD